MSCGKVIYATRAQATATLHGLQTDRRERRSKRQPSRAYYCRECDGYHLETEGKKRRLPRLERPIPESVHRAQPRHFGTLIIHHRMKIK